MGAYPGKDLLLKLDRGGTGSFETVAGLRSRALSLGARSVDITNSDSTGRWRELLSDAGTRFASLSGSGVFKDSASDAKVRELFFEGAVCAWQVVIPSFGVLEGPFHIASLDYAGEVSGELTYSLSLESAGALSFTVEAS